MALGGKSKSESIGFNMDSSIATELGVQGGDGTVVRDGNSITTTKHITTNTLDGGAVKASIGLADSLFTKAVGFVQNASAQSLAFAEGNSERVIGAVSKNTETNSETTMKYGLMAAALVGAVVLLKGKL